MIEPNVPAQLLNLETEAVDPRFGSLDVMPIPALIAAMNDAEQTVPLAVRQAAPQIESAIALIVERLERGGRLFYIGAGTAGRMGVLDASECPPTFSTPPDLVQGIIAGGPRAIVEAIENSEDDTRSAAIAVSERGIGPRDVVVGISASGRTPYVLAALEASRALGAATIGLSCNRDTEVSSASDVGIEVIVGPEILSGSTRLKAGSAQKQVLNMLSTITMVRLGKTYGNLMVDVSASNAKLRARAVMLVMRIAQVTQDVAAEALAASSYRVPVAVVALLKDVSPQVAQSRLDEAGGRLRAVLES